MRIIAGSFKNRRILSSKGPWLRPTSDRTRETIFSLLGRNIEGRRVLDLFAGTGALGIEAVSRGAEEATFVDRSPQAVEIIEKNLQQLHIPAQVYKCDAMAFIRRAGKLKSQFDLVFCDPPYGSTRTLDILKEMAQHNLISPDGYIVLETSARSPVFITASLTVLRQKKMGDTCITIYGQNNAIQ